MSFRDFSLPFVLLAALPACHREQTKIEGIRWVLTELMGQKVTPDTSRPVYFHIDPDTQKVDGFAGCNRFFGEVRLATGQRIRFANMGATQMACTQMDLERHVLDTLERADNFTLVDGVLALNKTRMAPLARFTAGKVP